MTFTDLPERFRNKIEIEPNSGCWLWTGALSGNGYAKATWEKRQRNVHRLIYEQWVCSIDAKLETDHLCRTRCCVNPSHLEIVSRSVNQKRGLNGILAGPDQHWESRKTHCPKGYVYFGSNLIVTHRGDGRPVRQCRICQNAYDRKRRAQQMTDALT